MTLEDAREYARVMEEFHRRFGRYVYEEEDEKDGRESDLCGVACSTARTESPEGRFADYGHGFMRRYRDE